MVLDDYKEMAGILGSVKDKFLLTINDLPEVREVLKDFKQLEVSCEIFYCSKECHRG